MDHKAGALAWWDAGMSVVPVRADGTKRPMGAWTEYQHQRADRATVEKWYRTAPEWGVGLICGEVSGGLEMFELEGRATDGLSLDEIEVEMRNRNVFNLWQDLMDFGYTESTPSGGIHFLWRIIDQDVPGNTKIAQRPATAEELAVNPKDKVKVLAETRGEGGFVVVAPSGGTVHKTGESWSVLSGEIGTVPDITWHQRCQILAAVEAALDQMPTRELPQRPERPVEARNGNAPGEDYSRQVNWHDLLQEYGWSYESCRGREEFWTRPGKDPRDGASATLYYEGSDNLYVFSSSTELPTETPISKFAFYTFMEHRGDFSAAARALSRAGYGTRSTGSIDLSDWFETPEATGSGVGGVVEQETAGVEGSTPDQTLKGDIEQFSEKGVGRFAGQLMFRRARWVAQEKAWRVYRNGAWARDLEQEVPRMAQKVSDMVDDRVATIMEKAKAAVDNGEADGKERLDGARKLQTFAKGIASNRGLKAVAELAATYPGVGVSAEAFDVDMTKIVLDNGTFDLTKMEIVKHDPGHMVTKRIPIAYDPDARADRWIRYLEEVLPDPAYRDYLQRAAGMALLGDTSEAAFFVLWGETGCGKSQFLEVMNAVFGDYGVTAAPATFRESRNGDDSRKSNSLHALRGARFVATSETSERSALSGELVKRVTGGDTVKSHALYESEIAWRPVFTMFMGTNFRPVLDANDGAIWRRVKPIHFPNSFFKEGQPTANREKGLADRIIATELPGVLNWVLEGVAAYRTVGLKDPDSMRGEVTAYREDSDPVLAFVNEAIDEGILIPDPEGRATSTELYRLFATHSRDNGIQRPLGKNKFGSSMDKLGYEAVKGTGGVRYRTGLRVNTARFLVETQRPVL